MRNGLALAAVCLGFGMVTLDATIVNLALPAIQQALGGSRDGLQWVVDSYTVALAAVLLSSGTAADRFGARRVYLAGLGLFVLASAACAVAPDLPVLVAARTAQGLGAAGLIPPSLSLTAHLYPDQRRRARALGIWGGTSGLGMALGPVLGGLGLAFLGWQSVFVVNIPVGIAGFALVLAVVPETARQPRSRLDFPGQVSGILALALLAGGLIEASRAGWGQPDVLALLGGGAASSVVFLVVEWRATEPMLPLRVFRSRLLSAATGVGLLFNFCLYGTLFCVGLYLQQVRGWSALATGMAVVPMTVLIGVNAFLSGRLTARLGPRVPMVCGLFAGAVGAGLLAGLGPRAPIAVYFAGSVVMGCCSLAMPAMTSVAMHALPPGQAGLASGVLNAARQAGGALGIALLGSLLGREIQLTSALPVVVVAYALAAGLALTIDQRRYQARADSPNTAARSAALNAPHNSSASSNTAG